MTTMLEGCASNIASQASISTFSFATRHVNYCIDFKKYAEDFHIKLKNLESTLNDAQTRERRARDNNEEITEIGKDWLVKAKHLIDDAGKLQKKTLEQSKCVIWWCPNCISRYSLGKNASKMISELEKHIADFKYDNFSCPVVPLLGMEFYASKDFVYLDSRKVAYSQLWEALQDEQKLRVGVYAMGGLGKTTLVKDLGYKVEEEKLFEKVVFVVVSNPPVVRRIQENIASQLGLKFRNNHEFDRARELWLRLTKGEKILVILDDVWEKLDFKAIGIPFEDSHKGCKFILTTRMFEVCNSLECQLNIELSLLTEEDSWKLFQKYANISNNPSIPLDVAKDIARECKRVPVAIATVASTLKDKEPQEWEDALEDLKNAEPLFDIDENLLEIYNCLRLSYNNLKSIEVQQLFLLCSFFPKGYEIPLEILTRYALGLGLFGDNCTIKKARRQTLQAKKTLINSCLLLNVEMHKGECVKMPDLIREVAQWIANKEIKEIMESDIDEDALDKGGRCLWFQATNDLTNQLTYPKLEILMISLVRDIKNGFSIEMGEELFKGLGNLHVPILTTEHSKHFPLFHIDSKLPLSMQVLKNLRVLHLHGWKFGDISVIGSLWSLQSLEMSNCEINELPSKMVELNNLKLLDLSYCLILRSPFQVIMRFTQLEELYYFSEPDLLPWRNDSEISEFCCKNCQLTNLRRYRIQIGDLADQLGEQYLITRGLSINRFHPSASNGTIKSLVGRAGYLKLKLIRGGYENIVPEVVVAVGGKIQWSKLSLDSCNDIDCLFDATNASSKDASVLSGLVELQVDNMENLRELCHGTPPSSSFEKLEELFVRNCSQLHGILFVGNLSLGSLKVIKVVDCPMLTSLFTLSRALSLELLEELKIMNCMGMKFIIADEGRLEKDVYDQKISSASIFQKLKTVVIRDCESMEFILPVCLVGRLMQLKKITISDAANLKHIFGEYQDEGKLLSQNDKEIMLPSLQKITLRNISNFKSIFPIYCPPKRYTQEDPIGMEFATPTELHPSKKHSRKWYTSTILCLSRQFVNLCDIKNSSQVETTRSDATTSKTSKNKDARLISHISAVQYCLSRQLLNMCYIRNMNLTSLPTTVISLFTLSTAEKMLLKKLNINECHGLKHLVTNEKEVDFDGKSRVSIFLELQDLYVDDCSQLEFIFPRCSAQCPAKLKSLSICNAPELKSVFGQCYHSNHLSHENGNVVHMESHALRNLICRGCPKLATKSIYDFMSCSDRRQPDGVTNKATLWHKNMLNIDYLSLDNIGIEGIFLVEGLLTNEQATSRLLYLALENLPNLSYICKGPLKCLSFQNLTRLCVKGCGKLNSIFSTSVLNTCLQQLDDLTIENCNELEKIIEDDDKEDEDQIYHHNVNFPNLVTIGIEQCNKLKYLFFISQSNEFPKLKYLSIKESSQLEQVFRWRMGVSTQDMDNTLLPNLKLLILLGLPCLTNVCRGFDLKAIDKRYVEGCPGLPTEYQNGVLAAEGKEANQEEAKHEDLELAKRKINDQKENKDAVPQTSIDFSSTTPPGLVLATEGKEANQEEAKNEGDLELAKRKIIDQKENRVAAPQTSIDFPITTPPGPTPAKPAMVASSTESENRSPSQSTMLVEITVDQTETSVALPQITSLNHHEYQNAGEGLSPKLPLSSSAEQLVMRPVEEYAAFLRDLGEINEKHIPLLEQAMVNHPSLWAWREKYKRIKMKQFGFSVLGDILEFLETTRWKDLSKEKKAEFESLMIELETFGFDTQWLRKTEALIKQSNIDEKIINQVKTLEGQEMKQKTAVKDLETHLQKAKMELANTTFELDKIKSENGDLDSVIGS